jgi:hypothetical protein
MFEDETNLNARAAQTVLRPTTTFGDRDGCRAEALNEFRRIGACRTVSGRQFPRHFHPERNPAWVMENGARYAEWKELAPGSTVESSSWVRRLIDCAMTRRAFHAMTARRCPLLPAHTRAWVAGDEQTSAPMPHSEIL